MIATAKEIVSGSIDETLQMARSPQEEAAYLIQLYEDEALQIAKDCMMLFKDANQPDAAEYWYRVCNFIDPNLKN